MTGADDDRRAELIAAAVDDTLSPTESIEFERLRADDASIDREVAELRAIVSRSTSALGGWDAATPSGALRDRVIAIGSGADRADAATPATPVPPETPRRLAAPHPSAPLRPSASPKRRARAVLWLAAAACLVVGATIGGLFVGTVSQPTAPNGPPGTLGAIEDVTFTGEPSGAAIDGAVVAHTWGTETVLHIDGLEPERNYSVVLIGTGGDRFDSGTFIGSTVTVDCRMNAAVLREDVATVEIEDADGRVIAEAALPDPS